MYRPPSPPRTGVLLAPSPFEQEAGIYILWSLGAWLSGLLYSSLLPFWGLMRDGPDMRIFSDLGRGCRTGTLTTTTTTTLP